MSDIALQIDHLSKTYVSRAGKERKALEDVSFHVPVGGFFGLLGPNGAGKSTLINIIAGLVTKSAGRVEVMGFDIESQWRQAKLSLGVVPQEIMIDPFFTVRETLEFYAGYYGLAPRARQTDMILSALGLSDKAGASPRSLSGGMKRRLLIAKALVHNPKLLILDEPTAGVDVELREQLWAYVRELNKKGTTIMLTTHYLEEAEALCDHVAIMHHGQVRAIDKTKALMNQFDRKEVECELADSYQMEWSNMLPLGVELRLIGSHRVVFSYSPSRHGIMTLLEWLQQKGAIIRDVVTREAELEDVFKHVTSKVVSQ